MRRNRASAELGTSPIEWEETGASSPVLAVAVHAGHRLRPEVASLTAVSEAQRLREEDPGTDILARAAPVRGVAVRSRFEVDLNRPRDEAVYVEPSSAWDLDLWKTPPSAAMIERSLTLHDRFYRQLGRKVAETVQAHGAAVVLDIHSYNYRRDGRPEDPSGAPDVNIGTGSLDRKRWGHLVDSFMEDLVDRGLDARENVRFWGREVARFVHAGWPDSACCLAIEFKKTYMDETTGAIDRHELERLQGVLSSTIPGLEKVLDQVADRAS